MSQPISTLKPSNTEHPEPSATQGATMTEPHSTAPDAPARGAAIDLHNFGWHHPGREKPAFSNVNLRIEPGQKVLLLGPSGAGKSTLLHAIAGVLHDHDGQSQSGSARIDGVDPEDARGLIGLMQQDPESSVVLARVGDDVAFGPENLAVAREEIWARVDDALAAVGLDYLPHEHPTNALSGGQKQRLGLAGILAMHPRAILLDEPTANLDPEGVQQVRDAVVQAVTATGATLIVVEHRVGVWAQHMDRVIVLGADGGITHDGAPETVLAQARETLIANGVWVPGYVPEPAAAAAPSGRILLSAENLAITREFPSKKQLRARRRQLKTMPEPAPVPLDIPALRGGINLSMREGEHLSILGPNGAGKSTLALTLAGLLYAPNGTLHAHEALREFDQNPTAESSLTREKTSASWDIPSWSPAQLLGRIGYVFQEPEYQFVRGSVREELELGPRRLAALRREKIDEDALAAATASLAERLHLEGLLDANPFTLSVGQKRRLSVASALATAPRVLILDEPTFGQDASTWGELVRLIRGLLTEGVAVISVTHDLEFTAALGGRSITLESLPHEPADRGLQEGK